MNCGRFQNLLFDYLDGSLSAGVRARVEAHLANCSECREALGRQKQLARSLSERLQQETANLEPRSQLERRVLAALRKQPTTTARPHMLFAWWVRLVGAAAATVVIAVFLITSLRRPLSAPRIAQIATGESQVSIQVSGCAPVYTFRQEGNLVLDCLSCRPYLLDQVLWPGKSRNQSHL
jgi:anti-sigma factor RsiW